MDTHIRFSRREKTLILLDQRFLPVTETYFYCSSVDDAIFALQSMVVRGAPAIGITAGYACCLAAFEVAAATDEKNWQGALGALLDALALARPTAVNLHWGVERMRAIWRRMPDPDLARLTTLWMDEAKAIHEEDLRCNRAIGGHGACLIQSGDCVMTHCNAGALATAGYGTALGVIRGAIDAGKTDITVIANETRPFLQGARLTAWELQKDGIPVTVSCDNACGLLMQRGMVHKVVVGADRIAANGDVANKIGTYSVALLAREHNVPFYVAAPLSTIDQNTATGIHIPIEERTPLEVTHVGESRIVPDGVPVYNYAFDITPARLITGIVTEQGVLYPPYDTSIADIFVKAAME